MRLFCISLLVLATMPILAREPVWKVAVPGWRYEFPSDHFSHPDFKTEWWYFTGNLEAHDGREFGFQLTFFRQGIQRGHDGATRFSVRDIKLAHFAVTDLDRNKFRFAQKISRGAFDEAGFTKGDRIAWIDDWSLDVSDDGTFLIKASDLGFALDLHLTPRKAHVLHGENGVSQKSAGEGRASHYYSFTRLEADGRLILDGNEIPVRGWSWFDQEWATNQLTEEQTGWDWLSLQFQDNTELMLFQIRLKEGGRDPFSHGTWVDSDGNTVPIKNEDFELVAGKTWRSGQTEGEYPVAWKIRIPKLQLELDVTAAMNEQELVLSPIAYWEGSVRANGNRGTTEVKGRGYLEMTGYGSGIVGLQAPDTR